MKITKSETWCTGDVNVVNRILNETLERIPRNETVINTQVVVECGMYRFYIFTKEE